MHCRLNICNDYVNEIMKSCRVFHTLKSIFNLKIISTKRKILGYFH